MDQRRRTPFADSRSPTVPSVPRLQHEERVCVWLSSVCVGAHDTEGSAQVEAAPGPRVTGVERRMIASVKLGSGTLVLRLDTLTAAMSLREEVSPPLASVTTSCALCFAACQRSWSQPRPGVKRGPGVCGERIGRCTGRVRANNQGNKLFRQGRWARAAELYQQAVAQDARDAKAWSNLAQARLNMQE